MEIMNDFKLLTEASNDLFSYKKKPEKQEITIQLIEIYISVLAK
jgi:hypothetical protein